ncbi:fungal-specific transcription factor domain-containing protein [Roridomyces roridus]|uniref:Fungal-specific transcription factor domain-containing protein n=1 Tax=Roridomyces roridus TaxID=1738132 RepID=A0AAD7FUZ3_9AGAR|nr:fungal-specific transcription factor domain-containing protein [Roridomyces roridus]
MSTPGKGTLKTRRIQRSCDKCRASKVRCDGPGPGGSCSHCSSFGEPCTYEAPARPRGPKSKLVEDLRRENATLRSQLEALLCTQCSRPLQLSQPYESISPEPSPPHLYQHDTPDTDRSYSEPERRPPQPLPPKSVASHVLPEDSDEVNGELAVHFGSISIAGMRGGLFGSASSFALVRRLALVKARYLKRPITLNKERQIYWERPPWEDAFYKQRPRYHYPEPDLIDSLVKLYFENIHFFLPLLHRPSFERQVAERLHLSDSKFGATLLAVLGLASRYSDDPRVLIDGNTLSSGWLFVVQVQTIQNFFEPTVHDVQFYCLMTLYWLGTSAPHTAWLYLGIGVRFLNFRGERDQRRDTPKWDEELWNRAFWAFFALDRLVCTFLGRPALIHMEDHDVDPPLAIDDEYWDRGFVQPLATPSLVCYFPQYLRLSEILGDALNQLYAPEKVKIQRGWTTEQGQETVGELDALMNNFLENVPAHLRWDPERPTSVFFIQSAMLSIAFFYIKITIHRRYIYIDTRAALSKPALHSCLDAARAALSVMEVWLSRTERLPLPFLQNPMLVSATVLLLNIFVSMHAGAADPAVVKRDLAQVGTAIKFFKICETRWQAAGRLYEVLSGLQSLDEDGGTPPPPPPRAPRPPRPANSVPTAQPYSNSAQPYRSGSHDEQQQYVSQLRGGLGLEPGTSIEQLLAETPALEGSENLMSLWMLPNDVMNVDQSWYQSGAGAERMRHRAARSGAVGPSPVYM